MHMTQRVHCICFHSSESKLDVTFESRLPAFPKEAHIDMLWIAPASLSLVSWVLLPHH